MEQLETTCWTLIEGAADGRAAEREEFVRRYGRAVASYLGARWRLSPLRSLVEDAAQEVFLQCFKEGGVLGKVKKGRGPGFRAFLCAVSRNVARNVEARSFRSREGQPCGVDQFAEDHLAHDSASQAFDRAWALGVLGEAMEVLQGRAALEGTEAERDVELLRLNVCEGLSIRDLAQQVGCHRNAIHRALTRVRADFARATRDVLESQHPGDPAAGQRAWDDLRNLVP